MSEILCQAPTADQALQWAVAITVSAGVPVVVLLACCVAIAVAIVFSVLGIYAICERVRDWWLSR